MGALLVLGREEGKSGELWSRGLERPEGKVCRCCCCCDVGVGGLCLRAMYTQA